MIAKVLATNKIGNSDYSQNGSGANLITKPDAPTALAEDSSIRSPTALGITWIAP